MDNGMELVECPSELPEEAKVGIGLFNAGKFFEAHEHLEIAWRTECTSKRYLYIGVLQAGVAYYHIQRCNYRGALKVMARSRRWLNRLPEWCGGINIQRLREDLDRVEQEVRRLGAENLIHFDTNLFRQLEIRTS